MVVAVLVKGKKIVGIAQGLYRCNIVVVIGIGRGMEFLQTKNIRILLGNEVKHFKPFLAALIMISFQFNEPGHIPGGHPKGTRLFGIIKTAAGLKGKKKDDTPDTEQKGNAGDQCIFRS